MLLRSFGLIFLLSKNERYACFLPEHIHSSVVVILLEKIKAHCHSPVSKAMESQVQCKLELKVTATMNLPFFLPTVLPSITISLLVNDINMIG